MYTELCHHGVLGMKWGVRRYQNKDGSLTPAGKKRYNDNDNDNDNDKDNSKQKVSEDPRKEITEADRWPFKDAYVDLYWGDRDSTHVDAVKAKKKSDPLNQRLSEIAKEAADYVKKQNIAISNANAKYTPREEFDEVWYGIYENEMRKVFNVGENDPIPRKISPNKVEHEINKKYASEMRGAILKDLGYKDTEAGRKLLYNWGISDDDNDERYETDWDEYA